MLEAVSKADVKVSGVTLEAVPLFDKAVGEETKEGLLLAGDRVDEDMTVEGLWPLDIEADA